jgi:hypothetical protein
MVIRGSRPQTLCLGRTSGPFASPLEFGYDYPGWDIDASTRVAARTPEECRTLCFKDARCSYFAFRPDLGFCYMKTKDAGVPASRTLLSTGIAGSIRSGMSVSAGILRGSRRVYDISAT